MTDETGDPKTIVAAPDLDFLGFDLAPGGTALTAFCGHRVKLSKEAEALRVATGARVICCDCIKLYTSLDPEPPTSETMPGALEALQAEHGMEEGTRLFNLVNNFLDSYLGAERKDP